jgi:endonuclease/exonuclease/phosphatase family metal-dependent hydrolase
MKLRKNENMLLMGICLSAPLLFLANQAHASCAQELNHYSRSNSASVVIENDRALLVWVPYGSSPGWDLPGGRQKYGEYACETAERETCEESGFEVRATEVIQSNVFRAQLTGGRCTEAVDEGFLDTRWVTINEIDGLQFRGGTWGDKKSILKSQLQSNDTTTWHPSCEQYMIDALSQHPRDSAPVEGMRWNTEPVSWRACVEGYQNGSDDNQDDPSGQTPYNQTAVSLPGVIQVEEYDLGGENTAFFDLTSGNSGSSFRNDDVDIAMNNDGGYHLGWVSPSEWLEFTVNVSEAGEYDVYAKTASDTNGGNFHLELSGATNVISPMLTLGGTGGWQSWTATNKVAVSLNQGEHVVRLVIDAGEFNIDEVTIQKRASDSDDDSDNGSDAQFKVMTYNLRTEEANDPGEKNWYQRKDEVMSAIYAQNPDIIGWQEAAGVQQGHVLNAMGSEWKKSPNAQFIYDGSLFIHKDGGIIDLPSDQWERYSEWARLQHKASGQDFIFVNNHWAAYDATGELRQNSAYAFRDGMQYRNDNWETPTIFVGDLNTALNTGPIQTLINETPFSNFYTGNTFNAWNSSAHVQLDYIMGSKVQNLGCSLETYQEGAHPPSDHYPITCEVKIQGNAQDDQNSDTICVFDYDLTLSSHACPATQNKPEYHCSNVGSTYGWTDQCLATAATQAVQTCLSKNAKLAIASHSPYDQAKLNALSHTGWPAGAPVIMQPGQNKSEMIQSIKNQYQMPNANVIFWDDTEGNLSDVSWMDNVYEVKVDRGNPYGSNCGIQSWHIQEGWNLVEQ